MYRMVTTGEAVPEGDAAAVGTPPPSVLSTWRAVVPHALTSAYAAVCGTEPLFTNHTVSTDPAGFTGTLDYIFLSKECRAVEVTPLPTTLDTPRAPNDVEPSDHFLIAATVSVPANK